MSFLKIKNPCASLLRLVSIMTVFLALSCAGTGDKKSKAGAHFKLGASKLHSMQYQAAYIEFQKALKLNPRDKEIHNAIGTVFIKLDEYPKAEGYFLKAVRLDSDYSEAYNNLCFVYYTAGRWTEAERNCLKALENPLYVTPEKAYYNLARTYYRSGNFSGAIEAFYAALKRFPSLVPAYYGLAVAYNAQGRYGEAGDAIGKALARDVRFKGSRTRAEAEFRRQLASTADKNAVKDLSDYLEILNY
jgi:tetratricopeptide (TPR) repeat protein